MTSGKHPNQRPPPNYSVRQVLDRAEGGQHPQGTWTGQVPNPPDSPISWVDDNIRPTVSYPSLSRSVMIACACLGMVVIGLTALTVVRSGQLQGSAKSDTTNGAQLAQAVSDIAAASRPAASANAATPPSRMPAQSPTGQPTTGQPTTGESVANGGGLALRAPPSPIRVEAANIQIAAGAGETPWPITIAADAKSIAGSNIRVLGLPRGARLSSGVAGADGSWVISPAQAAALALTPPSGPANSKLKVMVEAADGTELASIDTTFEVRPAVIDTGPIAESANALGKNHSEEKALDLRMQGEERLAVGDLSSARMFFKRAADGGDAQAAVSMGATYDPTLFEALKVQGMSPDRELARKWYQRAVDLGSKDAFERMQALK